MIGKGVWVVKHELKDSRELKVGWFQPRNLVYFDHIHVNLAQHLRNRNLLSLCSFALAKKEIFPTIVTESP